MNLYCLIELILSKSSAFRIAPEPPLGHPHHGSSRRFRPVGGLTSRLVAQWSTSRLLGTRKPPQTGLHTTNGLANLDRRVLASRIGRMAEPDIRG